MNLENEIIIARCKEKKNIELKVREILKKNVELSVSEEQIGVNDNLIIAGMNSIMYIKFIVELEMEFGIEFDDEKLDIESNSTIQGLVDYINTKIC